MNVRSAALAGLLALSTLLGCASINGPRGGRIFLPPPNPTAKEQFARIKGLEGAWMWAPELGPDLEGLVVTYDVTAAGSAVVETMFPGDRFEMVTVYHLDGAQLVLTHYSSAGNQPTMRAESGDPSGAIHFDYIGATNLGTTNTGHMHRMSFLSIGPEELLTSWTFYENQKSVGDRVFKLVRWGNPEPAVEQEPAGVLADILPLPEQPADDEPLEPVEPREPEPEDAVEPAPALEPAPVIEPTSEPAAAEPEVDLEAELEALEAELEADIAGESAPVDTAPAETPAEEPPVEPQA